MNNSLSQSSNNLVEIYSRPFRIMCLLRAHIRAEYSNNLNTKEIRAICMTNKFINSISQRTTPQCHESWNESLCLRSHSSMFCRNDSSLFASFSQQIIHSVHQTQIQSLSSHESNRVDLKKMIKIPWLLCHLKLYTKTTILFHKNHWSAQDHV